VKTVSPQTVRLANGPTDEAEEFTYLESVVSTTGGIDQDVNPNPMTLILFPFPFHMCIMCRVGR